MNQQTVTTEFLLAQCARYPTLRPRDLLKALHQSVLGPGHFITDPAAGLDLLRRELAGRQKTEGPEVEELDGTFCRVHLSYIRNHGLAPETLLRLFVLSAETADSSTAVLEEKLTALTALARAGRLPFPCGEVEAAAEDWRRAGFPARHHSPEFRAAYAPAYRVVRREYARWLPLLAAIDRQMAEQGRVVAAIEGGAGSGKTTLAALLEKIYDCNVFHMDDFFLRPEQRTAARLAEPGGNMDRERFHGEVLLPLSRGRAVRYRRYDCHAQTLLAPVEMAPKALSIVEGAYSMHPMLAGYYGLSAFLRVTPEVQRARIRARNDPETAERFFSTWIPLEQAYFEATDTMGRCDLMLAVGE